MDDVANGANVQTENDRRMGLAKPLDPDEIERVACFQKVTGVTSFHD